MPAPSCRCRTDSAYLQGLHPSQVAKQILAPHARFQDVDTGIAAVDANDQQPGWDPAVTVTLAVALPAAGPRHGDRRALVQERP